MRHFAAFPAAALRRSRRRRGTLIYALDVTPTGCLTLLALSLLALACESKKKPLPPLPSSEPAPSVAAAPTSETPAVAAYPPGMAPPDDAATDAAPPEPKTGVCAFNESGYDGQDTKSNEKMIVKVKDDKIVAAEYSYRGSYALDGESDKLDIPLVESKWLELELPMTSGTKKFQVRIKADVIELEGVATEDADGDCQWEKPVKDDKKKKK
jgi:major membrane immunogen (membrane-anchored lipoprotein)